jgi:hypothetical protein
VKEIIMMKKRDIICLTVVMLILGGILFVEYRGEQDKGVVIGPPEAYEEPVAKVNRLKIDGSVGSYYDDYIDLVAFGPGSGWLKLKTKDGLSPMLSFKGVNSRDIKRFNDFSHQLGLPIVVEFQDGLLRISANNGAEVDKSIQVADITAEKLGVNSIMATGFFEEKTQTRMAIRKDSSGKVFVKAVGSPRDEPERAPSEKKVFMVQK